MKNIWARSSCQTALARHSTFDILHFWVIA